MGQISARNLTLGYGSKKVLHNLNLNIEKGEFLSIIGPSGVGKSTLLMGINATTSILGGDFQVLGQDLNSLKNQEIKALRAKIGVIFQGFNLVARMSVLNNIASGMLANKSLLAALFKYYNRQQYEQVYEYMKVVGIEAEALSRCDCLSGGQKQRVAIARAIAQKPEIILADEPISSLDPVSARRVMETLKHANEKYGITVVSTLHQLNYAKEYCNRVIGINQGKIVYDGPPHELSAATIERIYLTDRQHSHADDRWLAPSFGEQGLEVPA